MEENKDKEFYDKEFYHRMRDKERRIREIQDKEAILRREKSRIINEKPWYTKPQNIIAIFAIIFPIVVSYFITISEKDKKELTVKFSNTEPIILNTENIREKLSIKFDSSDVLNISKISFYIQNSGTIDITKSDFQDGPINLILTNNGNTKEGVRVLQVNQVNDAGQQNSELKVSNINTIEYLPSLLNKNDEIKIDVFILNTPNTSVSFKGKIIGGEIIGPIAFNKKEITLGYKTFILSLNSFFSFKWLTVAVFILFFALTALSSLFIFAITSEDEMEPKVLGIFMGISTSIISILCLIIMISTLLYV